MVKKLNTTKKLVGRTNRYSDEELAEFRIIVIEKMEKALADLKHLSGMLQNSHGTNDTARNFEIVDKAQELSDRDKNLYFIERLSRLVRDLRLALVRIEDKSYGICSVTGKLIPKDRLKLVPHATLSIEAKRQQKAA